MHPWKIESSIIGVGLAAELFGYVHARKPETDEYIGNIAFSASQGVVCIKDVSVVKEFRRQGVATSLYQHLLQEYPKETIYWSSLTPQGALFRNSLAKKGIIDFQRDVLTLEEHSQYNTQVPIGEYVFCHAEKEDLESLMSGGISPEMDYERGKVIEPIPVAIFESTIIAQVYHTGGDKAILRFKATEKTKTEGENMTVGAHFDVVDPQDLEILKNDGWKPLLSCLEKPRIRM